MRHKLAIPCLALFAALLFIPACVELTGQRISWFHDAAKDRLQVFIHYDGIHEGSGSRERGEDQIPEFVANGDILIVDWPMHLEWSRLRAGADPDSSLRDLIAAIHVAAIGHYREPSGEMGALRLVTIEKVSEFLSGLNQQIDKSILALEAEVGFSELPLTWQRCHRAATKSRQWISLDGQALRLSLPIHRGEWAEAKRLGLEETFANLIRDHDREGDDHIQLDSLLTSLLSSAPVSYLEEEGELSLQFGSQQGASTLRLDLRDNYEPSLEAVVTKTLTSDLDAELGRLLVDDAVPADASPMAALLRWGPPEVPVRALMHAMKSEDAAVAAQARSALKRWASNWNGAERYPAAPELEADAPEFSEAWANWYRSFFYGR